ncbi:MAG: bifunctional DNA-formamidopyrimidine glycosylase/DNA-(apurinic or apyrimidinic site) lyase [Patescibacteria group bacterium]
MPELPEVETIARELSQTIIDKKIVDVIVYNPKVIKEPKKEKFIKELKNVKIEKIIRKGKLLILELSPSQTRSSGKRKSRLTRFLTIHLRMTGQIIYPSTSLGTSPQKSTRVSFKLSNGKIIDFNDSRLLGELRLIDDWQNLKFIKELGPEPFEIDVKKFKELLKNRKTKIKVLIMDQKFISGVGNLYAAEALFRAKIDPRRPADKLSDKEKELLFREIKNVLTQAIKYGGSSVDSYVKVSGKKGDYMRFLKVYDRKGEKCYRCKGEVQRISLSGRGTYFCPRCQK